MADDLDGWSCPRGGFGPHDRRLFHLSPDERRALGTFFIALFVFTLTRSIRR